MATKSPLGNLFGRSPIGPIQEHMRFADSAAQYLPALFEASFDDDWAAAREAHKAIEKAEKQADKLKRDVRKHLPGGLFLPVPRSDLLTLVATQDKVANSAKDAAGLVIGRQVRYPDTLRELMLEFVRTCAETSGQALKAVQELDELLAVGFSGREVKHVESMLKVLDKLERESDRLAVRLRAELFKLEANLPPVEVVFYYQIIGILGEVADNAESVGDRLQILLAR